MVMGFVPQSAFIDLPSERAVAFLTGLSSVQNGNLEMVRNLEFDLSESALSCNGGTIQKRNCPDIFVGPSQRRSNDADLDFLGI
jgi:hypothetical protein